MSPHCEIANDPACEVPAAPARSCRVRTFFTRSSASIALHSREQDAGAALRRVGARERLGHRIGDGRTRLNISSLVDSFEARDAMLASGMEEGVVQGYERLDEVLSGS